MKLLQSNMFAGNKLHCFKAMQVLGHPTQIWGFEIAKALPAKLRGDLELWYQRGVLNSGGDYEPRLCHD